MKSKGELMAKLVKDLMHANLITCKSDATLGQVAVMLHNNHVHALVVNDRDGRAVGIISDFDLLAGEWLSSDPESLNVMRKLTAAELMSTPVDSVESNLPLSEAVRTLIEKQVSRLLVTEDGKPVGIISLSDFVASIAEEEKLKRDTVGDVMSDAILVCRGKTPISSARAGNDFRRMALGAGCGRQRQSTWRSQRAGPAPVRAERQFRRQDRP